MARIVVVGGSLGGLRVTETLFAEGWDGEIVVVSEEAHPPYTRPPLSKSALLSPPSLETLLFKRRNDAERAEWRRGVRAVATDLDAGVVRLSDGSQLRFDGLVAATGVRARRLPERVGTEGHVVRTIEDSLALQAELSHGGRVIVIGAGFIGCEVAATAVRLGCEVDVVALDQAPLQTPLGRAVGAAVQRRHERHGVRFHLGRSVRALGRGAGGHLVELDDGTALHGDILVQAIGSTPSVDWLTGNGLDLSDGVACDNWMRMGGRPGLVAVGDVARFPNPLFDDVPRRVEHWQMPIDTARRAAATLLADLAGTSADPAPFRPLPSFWSDQYDLRLQSFGSPGLAETAEVLQGDLDDEAVVGYYRSGHMVGAVLLGMAKQAVAVRRGVLAELTSSRGHTSDEGAA